MGRIACAFSCLPEFLGKIDARARRLELSRSQYVVHVLRQDLIADGPELRIIAEPAAPTARKSRLKKG